MQEKSILLSNFLQGRFARIKIFLIQTIFVQ